MTSKSSMPSKSSSSMQTRRVGVARIPVGTTVGFKALPSATLLPATYAAGASDAQELDWAGIYPQLSFAQALAYLPNQFERGCTRASVVKLTAKREITLVVCADPVFMDGAVSSSTKAQLVRDTVQSLVADNASAINAPLCTDLPLMRACGECELTLCIPDAEGFELVVPKAMFTQEWLACDELFAFVESTNVAATVGQVVGQRLHRSVLMDLDALTQALEVQLSEHTCTALELAVKAALENLT